jgi:hypothetical protein
MIDCFKLSCVNNCHNAALLRKWLAFTILEENIIT